MDREKGDDDTIEVPRPKQRKKTPGKTGTIVHKSWKTYTRRDKHRKRPEGADEDEGRKR